MYGGVGLGFPSANHSCKGLSVEVHIFTMLDLFASMASWSEAADSFPVMIDGLNMFLGTQ